VNPEQKAITVRILDKEYRVSCPSGEEEQLLAAARHLNSRMLDIRRAGRVIGADRIAVMAGLNIAHELLSQTQTKAEEVEGMEKRLRRLRDRIEIALNDSNQLEL